MTTAPIFVSYARADSEFVLRLAHDLKSARLFPWVDQLDIQPGDRWDKAVEDALERSHTLVVVLSTASVASNNVMDEVARALESGKRVVPVVCQECKIPFRLARFEHVDLSRDYAAGLNKLIKGFSGVSPAPIPPAPTPPLARYRGLLIAIPLVAVLVFASRRWWPQPQINTPTHTTEAAPAEATSAEPLPNNATVDPSTLAKGPLNLQATARHATITTGEVETIDIRVTDRTGAPVSGATVTLGAGGGKFLSSATTPDASEKLMELARSVGQTGPDGVFTTWWACRPCAAAYGINVSATKQWYTEGKTELSLRMQ